MVCISKSFKSIAAGFALTIPIGASLLTGNVSAQPARSLASGSLCMAGETPIFSCPLGIKQAAVCGSGKQAIYRYGRPGKIEMASRSMMLAKQGFSGGGETQIQVTNKDYMYVLFDKTTRTGFGADSHNDPESRSGLLVRRGGRTLLSKECSDDTPIPSRAANFMPADGKVVAH